LCERLLDVIEFIDVARAMGQIPQSESILLLRLKALIGDDERIDVEVVIEKFEYLP